MKFTRARVQITATYRAKNCRFNFPPRTRRNKLSERIIIDLTRFTHYIPDLHFTISEEYKYKLLHVLIKRGRKHICISSKIQRNEITRKLHICFQKIRVKRNRGIKERDLHYSSPFDVKCGYLALNTTEACSCNIYGQTKQPMWITCN